MDRKKAERIRKLAAYYRRPWKEWTEEEKERHRRGKRRRRKKWWASLTAGERYAVWLKQKARKVDVQEV